MATSVNISLLQNLKARPDAARALESYRRLAAGYDSSCTRIEPLRQRAVQELALRHGETVFDVACGTGPTLPLLASAVGPAGSVVGIEMCPAMAGFARARIEGANLHGLVEVIESAVETLHLARLADALLLCYTHDVLQSPLALDRLIESAKPGARIVVLGMKTIPWLWGWPVNLFNLYRARRCLTTFHHLQRPWQLLEQRGAVLRVVHTALCGSAYIAVGTLPNAQPGSSKAASSTPRSPTPLQAV